ncbi:hypothetical protein HYU12_03745 [Candidatus Woesearchaeota archaeon]|nr:hypothetical protein [Candidatus Woesearchaeota archaeon]
MKFIYLYVAWMLAVFFAVIGGLISRAVFESLVIFGIAFAAAVMYKNLCEAHRHRGNNAKAESV